MYRPMMARLDGALLGAGAAQLSGGPPEHPRPERGQVARVLILFAHPALQSSRVHRRLILAVPDRPDITFHDLYEAYPGFDVDVGREQNLLSSHDVIVLQHPFYWYSTPPLIKQWEDLVLEHGWAYGSRGHALRGKRALSVISAGGREGAYQMEGYNRFTIRQLLAPVEQTFRLCGVEYLPPHVVFGTHRLSSEEIEIEAARFASLLDLLADDAIDTAAIRDLPVLPLDLLLEEAAR
jgi:glutathione-regulated potassium-efflux system ancillary protein KefG